MVTSTTISALESIVGDRHRTKTISKTFRIMAISKAGVQSRAMKTEEQKPCKFAKMYSAPWIRYDLRIGVFEQFRKEVLQDFY